MLTFLLLCAPVLKEVSQIARPKNRSPNFIAFKEKKKKKYIYAFCVNSMQSSQESDVDAFSNLFPPIRIVCNVNVLDKKSATGRLDFWTQFGVLSLIVGGTARSTAS